MQNQPSMAVCIYSDLHVGIDWMMNRVLRTSKLLPKVAICIIIFRYTYQVSILFDHDIICFEYQKVTLCCMCIMEYICTYRLRLFKASCSKGSDNDFLYVRHRSKADLHVCIASKSASMLILAKY